MKQMKGVLAATAMEYSPYALYEDQRNRFKHQSLMQDYEELNKETEATRNKLQMMKEKKLILLAEVRFLRRRYKFLMQDQFAKPLAKGNFMQPQNQWSRSRPIARGKNGIGKEAILRRTVAPFDLNPRGKNYSEKVASFQHSPPLFDLNQKQQKPHSGKEVTLGNSMPVLDLNQKERVYSGKEATSRSTTTPIFDLNQISKEEEELQANEGITRIEELKIKSAIRGGSDEQLNDMKLSVCRSTGNGPNRVGKRKISWQDQVALRV